MFKSKVDKYIEDIYWVEMLQKAQILCDTKSHDIVNILIKAEKDQDGWLINILNAVAKILDVDVKENVYWVVYVAILAAEQEEFSYGNMLHASMIFGRRNIYDDYPEFDDHWRYNWIWDYFSHPIEEEIKNSEEKSDKLA